MRRYHKWLMAAGIAAATPGLSQAEPFQLFAPRAKPGAQAPAGGAAAAKASNQAVAEQIAKALRAAKLSGYNIEVQFQNGQAILTGSVKTNEQRSLATRVVGQVPGVQSVDNKLAATDAAGPRTAAAPRTPAAAPPARQPAIQPVQYEVEGQGQGQGAAAFPQTEDASSQNQQMANSIADALKGAQFSGYNIEIQYQEGVALLGGAVTDPNQKAAASQIVSRVPGVQRVDNRLQVVGRPQAPPAQYAGYQGPPPGYQGPPPGYQGPPPGYQGPPGGVPGGPPAAGQDGGFMNGGPMPAYGPPSSGVSHSVYDQPHLPEHAWPSYAQYPNYAQVTYPSQYSASAWPYIGPFYPYPQVPLGWREAQLEWDDGYWNLNFRPRTSRWWWFLDPHNW